MAGAAGPLIGGYLLAVGSWRWVFFINLPLAAVVLVITARHVPESRDPDEHRPRRHRRCRPGRRLPRRPDLRADRGPDAAAGRARRSSPPSSWPPWPRPPSSSSSTAGPTPCSRSICSAPVSSAGPTRVTFVVYGALGGALFLLPVELQLVAGYSPLDSGLALLPLTLIMLVFSARSGALSARIGPRLQMTVGPAHRGGRPRAPDPRHRPRQLLDPGLPRRPPLRRRARRHGGPAHLDGHGRGTRRALRRRLGGEQRRGPGRRPPRRGRAPARSPA